MSSLRTGKRSSLPSLGLNKFFVNKRASMFENQEETMQERRNRSPCGVLETSERKMQARKEVERKKSAVARRKRRADPYADDSSGPEADVDTMLCPHVGRAVRASVIHKVLKNPALRLGQCVTCRQKEVGPNKSESASPKLLRKKLSGVMKKKKTSSTKKEVKNSCVDISPFVDVSEPWSATERQCGVWLCLACGVQGGDRRTCGHAFEHGRATRDDDLHCVAVSLSTGAVWCYECDCEAVKTHCKRLDELVKLVERKYEEAAVPPTPAPAAPSLGGSGSTPNLLTAEHVGRTSRSVTRTHSATTLPEPPRSRGSSASNLVEKAGKQEPRLPKGILNTGNLCFMNSVLQAFTHTHTLKTLLNTQLQAGQRTALPGNCEEIAADSDTDEIELKPLEVILSEGGALSLAMTNFFKEMSSTTNKTRTAHPGFLYQQVNKKTTQFQGAEEQDAHELLRFLLDSVRAEEVTRAKRAILRAFALNEKIDPLKVPPRTRKIIQGYGKQATHTVVDQVFGGQIISTVVCDLCKQTTQEFESFTDLSLDVIADRGKTRHGTSKHDQVEDNASNKSYSNSKHKKSSSKQRNCNKRMVNKEIEKEMNEQLECRVSEKKTPKDDELREQQQDQRVPINGVPSIVIDDGNGGKTKTLESSKYKGLMAARAARLKKEEEMGRGEEEEEGGFTSGEQEEYDHDLEDDIGKLGRQKSRSTCSLFASDGEETSLRDKAINNKRVIMNRLFSLCRSSSQSNKSNNDFPFSNQLANGLNLGNNLTVNHGRSFSSAPESETTEESDEESSEEEESGSDGDTTCSGEMEETDVTTVTKEHDDADVEDNADSEAHEGHPSIMVEGGAETGDGTGPDAGGNSYLTDSRYLNTLSASCDHLNYNSASDTSELYFTADGNGYDTPRRRYQSKDSLARTDDELIASFRRGDSIYNRRSVETLNSFRSCDRLSEEDEDSYPYRKYRHQWLTRSFTSSAPRYQAAALECSVLSGLHRFTAPQLLTGSRCVPCASCLLPGGPEVLTPAIQHRMLVSLPPVLTLHFKRFLKNGIGLQKTNKFVAFPLVLDLAPFTATITMNPGTRLVYGLYSVIQHSGRRRGGHYTAFVRSRPAPPASSTVQFSARPFEPTILERRPPIREPDSAADVSDTTVEDMEATVRQGQWLQISDEHVAPVSVEKVLKAQAYLLLYERIL